MAARRLEYLLLLTGTAVYYVASGEWLAWILLLTAVGLPWLSLLLSLPAIWSFQAAPAGAEVLEQGEEAEIWLLGSCPFPLPPFRGILRVTNLLTGKSFRYEQDRGLSTEHCGGYRVAVEKAKVCDYLGLFAFRTRKTKEQTLVVRPRPQAVEDLVDPQRMEINSWVPKTGGGYAENHEHRLYRPGDNLNQLHWKLSAKVGNLILREPMEPVRGAVLLTLALRGSPAELDRKFGRLLYAGDYLLQRELDFEIHALTGAGVVCTHVEDQDTLYKAENRLLCQPLAEPGQSWEEGTPAQWQYHIGGDADEA